MAIDEKILPTSFDARQLLADMDKLNYGSYPENLIESGKRHKLNLAMQRVIYDIEPRHLARVIAAKGFLPYYSSSQRLTYAQNFGFEKQGLELNKIRKDTLSKALVSNLYAAMDHIYWVFGSLTGEALNMIDAKDSTQDPSDSLDSILNKLNTYSSKILVLENEVLDDKEVMDLIGGKIGDTIDYFHEVIDRSWRNNPHWTKFHKHFKDQYKRASLAEQSIDQKKLSKYTALNDILHRLDRYK
jgi:hypothetical protein